jgi:2-polyprenyl-6-methoxyphenol hydroxylase-like FAD-dependent oxidoreductase
LLPARRATTTTARPPTGTRAHLITDRGTITLKSAPDAACGCTGANSPSRRSLATFPWKHATRGYVIAPVAIAGEILAVESSAPDGSASWLDVLDATSGSLLRQFSGAVATFAGPSIARGTIFWTDAFGHAVALGAPTLRR